MWKPYLPTTLVSTYAELANAKGFTADLPGYKFRVALKFCDILTYSE